MYIGKCLKTPKEMSKLEEDPAEKQLDLMEELDRILHGTRPHIPLDILEKAEKQVIKETLAHGAETARAFAELKAQEEMNKINKELGS